jgi:excinuclease ABC subunit B
MKKFILKSSYQPQGDQPSAIDKLVKNYPGISTLYGVTGSGKTYTIANVIQKIQKQTLIISPNKTLAAQLYEEFSTFFPDNKVCYFVSYYDYYRPESYLPASDIYTPKETRVNQEIERMRIESIASLVNRKDVIIIASVSCIYSLGNPNDYKKATISIAEKQKLKQQDFIKQLLKIEYVRNDIERSFGTFQVFPDVVEIILPYQKEILRVEFWNNVIERISWIHKESRNEIQVLDNALIFPAKYFITTDEKKNNAIKSIEKELHESILKLDNKVYRDRLYNRVHRDIEMIQETGFCQGIENYSAHFEARATGVPPYSLLDFFDEDMLLIIDESHIALPQLKGMYVGDQARKQSLVDYGFRLPSAKDNRPLRFEELEKHFKNVIFVSATPGEYEKEKSTVIAEQIIRPTGIVDPIIEILPRKDQLKILKNQIIKEAEAGYRTLVTVLTKKLAEDMATFLEKEGIKVCYIHHSIKTPQRTEILHKLRAGVFDCLIGINLLREGLDLPEVSLVAIMDADIESFLRDKRSLIQTIGRAARNNNSRVLFFADSISHSMQEAIRETDRRRKLQLDYNKKHNIKSQSINKIIKKSIVGMQNYDQKIHKNKKNTKEEFKNIFLNEEATIKKIKLLEKKMIKAADDLDFETAIFLREEWKKLKKSINALEEI